MATNKEIVFNILELLKTHTDDSLISDRHVLFLFSQHRAMFLRQLYSNRAKALDASSTQTLCLDMIKVDRGECGIETECYVTRSREKLPNLLSLRSRNSIINIRPAIVGSKSFEIVSAENVSACVEDKYSTTVVYIDNGYIYVAGPTPASGLIKCIRITAIFDNPTDLEEFQDCCECSDSPAPCVTEDTTYPIPGHLVAQTTQAVIKEYLATYVLTSTRDTDNDSSPNKPAQRQPRRR